MKKYSLAVFDMDGTLLDTLEDLKLSLNASLRSCGFPERTLEQVKGFVGNGIGKLVERGVPEGTPPQKTREVYEYFTKYYPVHCGDNTRAYPGIMQALRTLRLNGIMTAVVSNKADYAVKELAHRYFPGLFDEITGEVPGTARKPAPDGILKVISDAGVSRGRTVYIGDSEVDIEAAANAGVDCISVTWGFKEKEFLIKNGASVTADSPDELPALICGDTAGS